MLIAAIIFFASLALIVGLFSIKYIEFKRGERYAESMRHNADELALDVKFALVRSREELEKLPPRVAHHSLHTAFKGALGAASVARRLEDSAHRFADFVASKRGFERRETKSEFLKEVTNFKNTDRDEE